MGKNVQLFHKILIKGVNQLLGAPNCEAITKGELLMINYSKCKFGLRGAINLSWIQFELREKYLKY